MSSEIEGQDLLKVHPPKSDTVLQMTKEEKLLEKQKEIANYERILAAYRGRWWDMGKRHLDQLNVELKEIEDLPA